MVVVAVDVDGIVTDVAVDVDGSVTGVVVAVVVVASVTTSCTAVAGVAEADIIGEYVVVAVEMV